MWNVRLRAFIVHICQFGTNQVPYKYANNVTTSNAMNSWGLLLVPIETYPYSVDAA